MDLDPFSRYFKDVKRIENTKGSLEWELLMLEQYLEDSNDVNACKTLVEISEELEKIATLVKTNKDILKIHEVIDHLKDINEFTQRFETIVRGRSWYSMCRVFEPTETLDHIKALKGAVKKSNRRVRKREAPGKTPEVNNGGGLIDDEMIYEYNNRNERLRKENGLHPKYQKKIIEHSYEQTMEDRMDVKEKLKDLRRRVDNEREFRERGNNYLEHDKELDVKNLWM